MNPIRGMKYRLGVVLVVVLLTGVGAVGKVVPEIEDSGVVVKEWRQKESSETVEKEWVGIAEK